MNPMEQRKAQKLSELRAKTDRQLYALIGRLVDNGCQAEAERLLPFLSGADRRRMEALLDRARELSPRKSVYAA